MWLPFVSIILPAYNCEKYIAASVLSILDQVYDNFELIVVNDGSTDKTTAILASISDPRLRILQNESNQGLIYSLNRAINESKGEYIARMDADDIATNDRIEKQVHWLLHHPDTVAVGSFIAFINEKDEHVGDWPLDRNKYTAESIRHQMPKENCLAHPTMMIRSEVLKKYKYAGYQKNIEDYDLWLRLLGDGHIIEKIPQPLLWYRVHSSSVTQHDLKAINPFFKVLSCKWKYLQKERKVGSFQRQVAISMLRDGCKGILKQVKKSFTR